jgi:integrase
MARPKKGSIPSYRKHKPTGQAVVSLSGQDFYLGRFGTKVSLAEYDRQVAEWFARGRRPIVDHQESGEITIVELSAHYKRYAESYYRKNGSVTNEVTAILSATRFVRELYGPEPVGDFGPLKLQAVQQAMVRAGWCRKNINKQVSRIVRMFSWGVSQELVPAGVAHALREVKGLSKGRTDARETSPVSPVADNILRATLPYLPSVVADMVRFQRLTGCRPEEVCMIRQCDVDMSGSVWMYRPTSHKTSHHGKVRVVCIGPKGQEVLRPYLFRPEDAYCFSPAESERSRRAQLHQSRQTPLSCGNRPGTNRQAAANRRAGERYTTDSYRRAIHRACELAFEMPADLRKAVEGESEEAKKQRLARARQWRAKYTWHPNQLRHSAATEIRRRFGLEAAQVVLGHSQADVTQVYAERDLAKAAEVASAIG